MVGRSNNLGRWSSVVLLGEKESSDEAQWLSREVG